MQTLLALKRWQLCMLRNGLRADGKRWRSLGQILGFVAYLAFVFFGMRALFNLLAGMETEIPLGLMQLLQVNLLSGLALITPLVVLMTGLKPINDTLFAGDDLSFLLALPIPAQAVFASKFLDAFGISLLFAAPLTLGSAFAFGVVFHAPVWFYAVSTLVGFVSVLLIHSIVVLMLLLIMRFVPGQTMKQLFIILAGLGAVVIVFVTQIFSSRLMHQYLSDPLVLFEGIASWGLADLSLLPHVWSTKAILLPMPGFTFTIWESIVPLVIATAALTSLALVLSGKMYIRGWSSTHETAGRRIPTKEAALPKRWRSGTFWAVVRKDLLLLRREPLVWYQFVVSSIVLGFYFFNLQGETGSEVGLLSLLMPVLMAALVTSQLGGIGISREGDSFWLLRLNVLRPEGLYWAKLMVAAVPPVVLVSIAGLTMHFLTNLLPFPLPIAWTLMSMMCVGVAAFELLLDIAAPNFALKIEFGASRKGSAGSGKLILAMFGVMLYVFAGGLVLFLPRILQETGLIALMDDLRTNAWAFALGLVWVLVTVLISRFVGVPRLKRLLDGEK